MNYKKVNKKTNKLIYVMNINYVKNMILLGHIFNRYQSILILIFCGI